MTVISAAVRRASAVGLALTACLTALPGTTATAAGRDGGAVTALAGLGRFYHQRLDWRSCVLGPDDTTGQELDKAGARCADVTVPLDYAAPRGRTLEVAISRLAAADTRHRIGSLLFNPGGPGGPGLGYSPLVRQMMKEAGARYDVIGFDPRFVGRSAQLDCDWPVGSSLFSAGPGRSSFERQVTLQKGLADKCRATNASVLPYVTTRNTARDMDVVRGALGERKVSYLGWSYGTYLGTVYTQMFPGRYDRVVLDGALDPRRYNPRLMRGVERENDQALADWAAWAAHRNSVYGLGRTRGQVLATINHLVAASARHPLTVGTGADTFRLDDTQVPFVVFSGTADDTGEARAAFGEQLSVLAEAAAGQPTRLSPQFAAMLRGTLTGEGSRNGSVQTAILCGDVAVPRNQESYWRDIERNRAEHALFGPLTNNIGPCAFWDRPREKPTQVRHDTPALIVAATGDPRTPYTGSVALHNLLPSSKLLTLRGANRHAIYGQYGNACVDHQVNRYLATGKLPARDRTCVKPSR
ncbi:alpha/beta hydrolase [Streptomyces sp. NPDC053813]|uniref:alpha/beta hydrolase n=1 Tax=Streptomyces sp. NPDC053813 TaxID=3365717 RepID=UPI0037D60772